MSTETTTILKLRRGRGIILKNDRILLCNRRGTKRWYLPGGKADDKEFADKALCREIREELGWSADIDEYVGTFEHDFFDVRRWVNIQEVNVHFTLHFAQGELPDVVSSLESHLEFRWTPLPELSRDFFPAPVAPLILRWFRGRHPFYGNSHGEPKK